MYRNWPAFDELIRVFLGEEGCLDVEKIFSSPSKINLDGIGVEIRLLKLHGELGV